MRVGRTGSVAGCLLMLADPLGAATTSTFAVNAQVVAGCLVTGGATQYGTLNYGTQSALSTAVLSTALGGSSVSLQCTPGVVLSMSLDAGQNANAGVRNLKRTGGTQVVPYQLYQDAGLAQGIGIGQNVNVSYADPAAVRLPVYGKLQLPGTVPAGTYSDVVQVTLTW